MPRGGGGRAASWPASVPSVTACDGPGSISTAMSSTCSPRWSTSPARAGTRRPIADAVEEALRRLSAPDASSATATRSSRARTLGRAERVLICGHLDTVPAAGQPSAPGCVDGRLVGLGSCDMKGGVAVALALAATVTDPVRDVTYVFYEAEEIEDRYNGLRRLVETPSGAARRRLRGAHGALGRRRRGGLPGDAARGGADAPGGARTAPARGWGRNAIHAAADVLARLAVVRARAGRVDGLDYREGLNAVGIGGGVAGNVIPDECTVDRELPLRARPVAGRGRGARARGLRRAST